LPSGHPHHALTPDAFSFGGGGAIADELAARVHGGTKRATTSLGVEFTELDEPLPVVGSVSIVLTVGLDPVAIIERVDVKTIPFADVGAEYAAMTVTPADGRRARRGARIRVLKRVSRIIVERVALLFLRSDLAFR